MRLEGRIAAVTGAGGGIGGAVAAAFRAEGATVVEADLKADGLGPDGLVIDVSDPDDARRLTAETVARHGRIDILANVAGTSLRHAFLDVTREDFDRILRVNLYGSFYCAQEAARAMVGQGYGRIINIASISGVRAGAERTAYGISKAGVISLTQQAAHELAPFGITVNAIAPGPVDTELTRVPPHARRPRQLQAHDPGGALRPLRGNGGRRRVPRRRGGGLCQRRRASGGRRLPRRRRPRGLTLAPGH